MITTSIDSYWNEIQENYSKPNRYYHNLTHLDHLFQELNEAKTFIEDWQTIVFSIAYHDIIYNALKNDNEEKSAILAQERLHSINVPFPQAEKCRNQILATKGHHLSVEPDTNYFTDADLAILGSDENSYDLYTKKIRKEYKFFPDLVYKPGRKKY